MMEAPAAYQPRVAGPKGEDDSDLWAVSELKPLTDDLLR